MYYESYLCHHGIKGQKWGVRRYQNTDGSLTPAGKNRYSDDDNRVTTSDVHATLAERNRSAYKYNQKYIANAKSELKNAKGLREKKAAKNKVRAGNNAQRTLVADTAKYIQANSKHRVRNILLDGSAGQNGYRAANKFLNSNQSLNEASETYDKEVSRYVRTSIAMTVAMSVAYTAIQRSKFS
jgi:hypothetical protein